ncbi:ester cyclase [Ovoidimarina sediminis]|uniref:ester cyclase n=1 Tax=Ovoidimarina sediminis TaxID=3079856 RepID=UPI0029140669|nr:ester cyclase [Rhodophyticola sp. MJ-SS7]MDU8943814.1 ester cyclase [Rhodophyticola sp. MJ-SS7]
MSHRKDRLAAFLRRIWSEGEVAAVEEFIADRYTIHNDPGDPWHGQTLTRDGFADRLVTSRDAAPDQVFTVVDMIEEGDRIALTWTWTGTHLGDLPGLPATGRRIEMTGATVYGFDAEDRLTGHWQIADRLGIYRQLTTPAS